MFSQKWIDMCRRHGLAVEVVETATSALWSQKTLSAAELDTDKINTVSVLKSMQLGYLMACEDHGLPLPEFADPEEIVFGKNRP